ncbi:MAG: hypothetical protein R3255_09825 [Candidatus Lokiarchaeia archaeon]|nr:hypothetical protein [Candidatus Lokiarchaeia archaeon]
MSHKKPKKNKKQKWVSWISYIAIFLITIAILPVNEVNGNSNQWNDWSQELLVNPGFEDGNFNGWTTYSQFGIWEVGFAVPYDSGHSPQSGNFCAFIGKNSSEADDYISQDTDITSYISYIDNGKAVCNVSGWIVSGEYSPSVYDQSRIRIQFLSSSKNIISEPLDTGYSNFGNWTKVGIYNYSIPAYTRYIRVIGMTLEQLWESGSLDSFSAKIRTIKSDGTPFFDTISIIVISSIIISVIIVAGIIMRKPIMEKIKKSRPIHEEQLLETEIKNSPTLNEEQLLEAEFFQDVTNILTILAIHKDSGLCLSKIAIHGGIGLDEHLFTGFISAMGNFKNELAKQMGLQVQSGSGGNVIEYNEFTITLMDGEYLSLGLVSYSNLGNLIKQRCGQVLRDYEVKHVNDLQSFDGEIQIFGDFEEIIETGLDMNLNKKCIINTKQLNKYDFKSFTTILNDLNSKSEGFYLAEITPTLVKELKISDQEANFMVFEAYKNKLFSPIN